MKLTAKSWLGRTCTDRAVLLKIQKSLELRIEGRLRGKDGLTSRFRHMEPRKVPLSFGEGKAVWGALGMSYG